MYLRSLLLIIACLMASSTCGVAKTKVEKDGGVGKPHTFYFRRITEAKEGAFSVLTPKGWVNEGGIIRLNPAIFGIRNASEAKVDFTIKRDKAGSVMMRWLPDVYWVDMTGSPVAGMFPPWKQYNGFVSMPKMSPADFLLRVAFPVAHPHARNVRVVDQSELPDLAAKYTKMANLTPALGGMLHYTAAAITVTYDEDGTRYTERMITCLENFGTMGSGLWKNRETSLYRAAGDDYKRWAPVVSICQGSVKINRKWLIAELRASTERLGKINEVQQHIQRIDKEIVTHRQAINSEINNDMYLTLTQQEEYVNPHTHEVEVGSNEWKYRWQSANGDVIYTDDTHYDPNHDTQANRTDFKRSAVRQRKD